MAFGDIVLLKDKTPLGPFTRTQIQEGLSRGEFSARDLAHTPGLRDWLPLLEVLHHLDSEVVHWPRTHEKRALPPLPYAPRETAEAAPVGPAAQAPPALPPPSPGKSKGIAPALPPRLPQLEKAARPSAPSASLPPSLPLIEVGEPGAMRARILAWAIDWAVLFLPVLAVFGFAYLVWAIKGPIEHRDPETARQEQALLWRNLRNLVALVAIGFAWLYAAGLECSRWQGTIGKQVMGLKVTDAVGQRLGFLQASGRHAAKYLSALPVFLGFMAALFNARRLTWHDRLAGTRVVKR
jgi:uncharacterized RDD family membrane protein YckC